MTHDNRLLSIMTKAILALGFAFVFFATVINCGEMVFSGDYGASQILTQTLYIFFRYTSLVVALITAMALSLLPFAILSGDAQHILGKSFGEFKITLIVFLLMIMISMHYFDMPPLAPAIGGHAQMLSR